MNIPTEVPRSSRSLRRRCEDYAIEQLLDLKNSTWCGQHESALTADAFRQRIKLTGITFFHDGLFEVEFDGEDLFWGNRIAVSGHLRCGPDSAALVG